MFIQRKILVGLMTCLCILGSAYAGGSLEAEIQELRTLRCVAGSAVGIAAQPGAFFTLSKVFIEKGTEQDFLRMAEDENPVVRSMGLLCLAQYMTSLNTLKGHLTDTSLIDYCSGGCTIHTVTVGNFVRNLLNNANDLDHRGPHLPLLSEEESIGSDIEILAQDVTTSFHNEVKESLFNAFTRKEIALTLRELKNYAPNIETYKIIKAIGRIAVSDIAQFSIHEPNALSRTPITRKSPDSPFKQQLQESLQSSKKSEILPGIEPSAIARKQRKFLVSCMRDMNLDEASRLAAASALTRDADETVLSVIRSERANLNGLIEGNWGDHFLATLQNKMAHENPMKVVRGLTWQSQEHLDDAVIRALSNSHPLALPDLTNSRYLWLGPHHNEVCNAVGSALVEMSRNLDDSNHPWNTYSDTAYALNFIIAVYKGNLLFERIFTPARRSEIEKNVQKAIENHFEGKSNCWNTR